MKVSNHQKSTSGYEKKVILKSDSSQVILHLTTAPARGTPIFKNSRTRCSRPILGSMKIKNLFFSIPEVNLDISASFLDN